MKKTRIYLDNCCFNRPYDDQEQIKIKIETEAKLYIQEQIKSGRYDLIWSYILDYENFSNPDVEVRSIIQIWQSIGIDTVIENDDIVNRANELNKLGFGVKDSLHLSCAIFAKADYFITVDKGILKKKSFINDITILSPISFIETEVNYEI